MKKNLEKFLSLLLFIAILVSCQESSEYGPDESIQSNNDLLKTSGKTKGFEISKESLVYDNVADMLAGMNQSLAEQGYNVRISKLEYMTNGKSGEAGQTIFVSDRERNLESRWVPSDPRRLAEGNNITYLIDDRFRLANGTIDGAPAIDRSFETWDSGTECSDLPIIKRDYVQGMEPNFVLSFLTGVPANPLVADIVTTGFLPGFVFDVLAPNGSQFILGVCFTLEWVFSATGEPTDIDDNGKLDTALKEVWYNNAFEWSTDGSATDIETVALHENGHALELGHVGKIFGTNKNRKIHFAPRTIMNAAYTGVQREVTGIATSQHCENFGSWPNN